MTLPARPTAAVVLAAVDRVMSVRWQWGRADCCTAACDVFQALWGRDPMASVRGRYDSAMGAVRLIGEWGDLPAMAEAMARAALLRPSNGLCGDLGLSMPGAAGGPDGRAILICVGPGRWAGKTTGGYAILPNAERAWGV
ncbi:hypothetical protein ACEYYA_00960 [Paracoccus sp. p3-h83]|uniref:DUF6950 family protein n=1 Tax=Paracoccus sp. p3-h83 TaxID=3342805 RepID=UPI0035BA6F5C